jgi:hypothetical protein
MSEQEVKKQPQPQQPQKPAQQVDTSLLAYLGVPSPEGIPADKYAFILINALVNKVVNLEVKTNNINTNLTSLIQTLSRPPQPIPSAPQVVPQAKALQDPAPQTAPDGAEEVEEAKN